MWRGKSVVAVAILCGMLLLSLSISVLAQSALRIARPVDGATIREIVNILVPVSSVPEGGFITCIVDGRYQCATDSMSEDGKYYVYRWDTKAVEVSPETGEVKVRPSDGKHVISALVYGSDGKRTGQKADITVYVKNNASADMPSNGLKLRYKSPVGSSNEYHFKYTEDIKSIEGATTLAKAMGEAVEGAEGTVARSVEDKIYGDSVLVRQKLTDTLVLYYAGQGVPEPGFGAKSLYHVEDSMGHVTYVMSSSSPGMPIGIDLPILPAKFVKIGDTWAGPMKVFKNALTGESAKINATSTLEGLEWEGGYPCAKIKSTFAGNIRLPYSTLITRPLELTGEEGFLATTYFAYKVGKVVSFSVRAIANTEMETQALQAWFQQIMQIKGQNAGPGQEVSFGGSDSGGNGKQSVKLKLEFKQILELVH